MIAATAAWNRVSTMGRSWLSTIIGPEPSAQTGCHAPSTQTAPRLTTTSAPVGSGSTPALSHPARPDTTPPISADPSTSPLNDVTQGLDNQRRQGQHADQQRQTQRRQGAEHQRHCRDRPYQIEPGLQACEAAGVPVQHPIVQSTAQQQERQPPDQQQHERGQYLAQRQRRGITEQKQGQALGRKRTGRPHDQQDKAEAVSAMVSA